MLKVAVVLSGCGFQDGSEVNESVFTLLSLSLENIEYQCFAPDIQQHHVTNHLTGEISDQTRNVLQESARIARGDIKELSSAKVEDFDALIFPGGFGAATNLSDYADKGSDMTVLPVVTDLIQQFHVAGKPIGFICIAPMLAAKCFKQAKITIGNDSTIAEQITAMDNEHVVCNSTEIVVDKKNNIVSTPAFMTSSNLTEVFAGIKNCVERVILLARKAKRQAA